MTVSWAGVDLNSDVPTDDPTKLGNEMGPSMLDHDAVMAADECITLMRVKEGKVSSSFRMY